MTPIKAWERGLILGGGALLGSFTVGALLEMFTLGYRATSFDGIKMVSVGAQCGVFWATGQGREGLDVWLNGCLRGLVTKRPFPRLNLAYLMDIFRFRHPLNVAQLRALPIPIEVLVTECATGTVRCVDLRTANDVFAALTTTAAVPIFHKPIRMHGGLYMDGGFGRMRDVFAPIFKHAREVVVILTAPLDDTWEAMPEWAVWLAFPYPWQWRERRTMREAPMHYNKTLDLIREAGTEGRVRVIAPDTPLTPHLFKNSLDTNPKAIRTAMELGRRAAHRVLTAHPLPPQW